jgi:hypothetical protein
MSREPGPPRPAGGPVELLAVWALSALVSAAIFVTYSRLPARDLYHVSGSGLAGGASRVLVFLNFPVALAAIAVLLCLLDRLQRRRAQVLAVLGVALSAAVFWPGMVHQSDLDARPANAIAALGVAVALALTLIEARRSPLSGWERHRRDGIRLALAAGVLVLAVPWLAAVVGVSFAGVPVLGTLYQTGELRSQPNVPGLHPAVHHGDHHGLDGVLLILTALLLSRVLRAVRHRGLRALLGACLSLMFCYGIGDVANDFWLEQVVKRGWTDWEFPDVTVPGATIAWGLIVIAAAVLWTLAVWPSVRSSSPMPASRSEYPQAR